MKSLRTTAFSALALTLTLAPNVLAQERPGGDVLAGPTDVLPVAEAKKRYLESQRQLDDLTKGDWFRIQAIDAPVVHREALLALDVQSPRDRIRTAVAEAFDARRQLQQAELAELENRIARIKRALEIRDALRDTVIDQRTDELLEQIEEGGKSGQRDGTPSSGAERPAYPGAKEGVTTVPAESDVRSISDILILDVEEARVSFDAAERAYKRALNLLASGAIEQAVADEQAEKYQRAEIQLQRAKMKFDAFAAAHGSDGRAINQASADGQAAEAEKNPRLAELDVQEAEANLAAAKTKYERFKRHYEEKTIEQSLLDEQAEKYKRAQIELKRAKAKLKALGTGAEKPDANSPVLPPPRLKQQAPQRE